MQAQNTTGLEPLSNVEIPSFNFDTFWTWIKQTFTPSYQAEIEHYLAQATDHADLEHRMRYLERRGML